MRLDVGIGVERIQLASQGERIGEVVAAERPKPDTGRSRDRQPADRAVRIAEVQRPATAGVRFSRNAALPSFGSSDAKRR